MRRFALRNSIGEFFDLMRTDAFFADPSGLGFSKSNEYLRVGSSFIITKEESEQGSVTGTMFFESQAAYAEFNSFISKEPLILLQDPDGDSYVGSIPSQMSALEQQRWWNDALSNYYKLDGRFTSVEKSDTNHDLPVIECSVTFTAESKWYLSKIFAIPREDLDKIKYYNPANNDGYFYAFRYSNGVSSSIDIYNYGTEDSPTDIRVYGPVLNPSWELRHGNDVIATGGIITDVPAGVYLDVNSRNGHLAIAFYDSSTNIYLQNAYEYIDFDKDNFIIVPKNLDKNTPYTLRVTGESNDAIDCYLELEETYETV